MTIDKLNEQIADTVSAMTTASNKLNRLHIDLNEAMHDKELHNDIKANDTIKRIEESLVKLAGALGGVKSNEDICDHFGKSYWISSCVGYEYPYSKKKTYDLQVKEINGVLHVIGCRQTGELK